MPAGYSKTPLHKKPGIKSEFRLKTKSTTKHYLSLLSPLPNNSRFFTRYRTDVDLSHIFTTRKNDLQSSLQPAGMIWVSWPKESSSMFSEITENTIREVALPLALVDVKDIAFNETWSGLKLVIRRNNREN